MGIKKEMTGYRYTEEGKDFTVETSYQYGHIYLHPPTEDDDIASIEKFGVAIRMAVKDLKRDTK